uniref:Uncharacterized protein n=1 Tax=Rhizophora mucronata TaxID=61149 RepID=A0A2P2PC52_RHIMU
MTNWYLLYDIKSCSERSIN